MIKIDLNVDRDEQILSMAVKLVKSGVVPVTEEFNVFDLAETISRMQSERDEKIGYTDKLIDYNDEILSIEDVGSLETIDISVTGDNLFYCNNILTKNSFGIPAIADFFAAIIATDELKELNQMMFKQLKNRYSGLSKYEKFVLGVDLMTQTLIQLEDSTVKPEVIVDKKKKALNTIAPAIDLTHKITSSNTLSFDHFIL